MSVGAYFMHRGWMDNPVFKSEPYTEPQAWLWLIENAAWKECVKRAGNAVVSLKRGQLAASIRFMGEAWGWSKSRVERFLIRLKTGAMIGTEDGTAVCLITICNYDKYQAKQRATETGTGTDSGTGAGQERDKLEEENNKKETTIVVSRTRKPLALDDEMKLWASGKGFTDESLVAELEAHLLWKQEKGKRFKDDRAAFQRWMLNSRRFAAEKRSSSPKSFLAAAPLQTPAPEERYQRELKRWLAAGADPKKWVTDVFGPIPDETRA